MVQKEDFGRGPNGEAVSLWRIWAAGGMRAEVTDLGACLVSLWVPNAAGDPVDVVLGYDDAAGYAHNSTHFGAPMGRVANRIGGASFELDGASYQLAATEKGNALHSGPDLWRERMWELVRAEQDERGGLIELHLASPDGDQGYPGAVDMHVTYELRDSALSITYGGTPDARTLVSMTNHSYFNLNGQASGSALRHRLSVLADAYTETDEALVPTGRILPVGGTPLDLREARELGEVVESGWGPIVSARGMDHNYALPATGAGADGFVGECRRVATLEGDVSGIVMHVATDVPGMQVYTANWIEGEHGRDGVVYHDHDAVCLETQFFPDAIHHPGFVQPVFGPERPYRSRTVFSFGD